MTYCCSHGIDAKYKYCNIYNSFIATRFRCPLREKTVLQIKRTKLPFHFAKYFSFRLVKFISYFIHRKTNFCQALNRCMRISPVTSCEGSYGSDLHVPVNSAVAHLKNTRLEHFVFYLVM